MDYPVWTVSEQFPRPARMSDEAVEAHFLALAAELALIGEAIPAYAAELVRLRKDGEISREQFLRRLGWPPRRPPGPAGRADAARPP